MPHLPTLTFFHFLFYFIISHRYGHLPQSSWQKEFGNRIECLVKVAKLDKDLPGCFTYFQRLEMICWSCFCWLFLPTPIQKVSCLGLVIHMIVNDIFAQQNKFAICIVPAGLRVVSLARPIPLQARGRVWGNACIEFVSRRRKSCVPIRSLSFDYARWRLHVRGKC